MMRATFQTTRRAGSATAGAVAAAMALTLAAAGVTAAHAGSVSEVPEATSVIGDHALSDTTGVVMVNEAAGSGNAQHNSGVIAIGPNAAAAIYSEQHVEVDGTGEMSVTTKIRAQAFDGARGWIAVNQSAGQGNAQSNGLAIVVGGKAVAVTDVQLAQVDVSPKAGTESGNPDDAPETTKIANTAFSNVTGIVQVNQSAGRGNVTANRVHVRISVAAP